MVIVKKKSCLTSITAFCSEVADLPAICDGEEQRMFTWTSAQLLRLSHNTLVEKLVKYKVGKRTVD